jgi:hypothetical protein
MKIHWIDEIAELKRLGSMGTKMPVLAKKYGVSKQRIKQVLDQYIPEWYDTYGAAVDRKLKTDARYAKWGVREDSELYSAKRTKFNRKKANASKSGLEWSLSFGDLSWPTHCPILGIELDYFTEMRQENSVSFDRIDSTKGYITGNVQVISWRANRIKNDGTAGEHRKIASYLDSLTTTPQAEGATHEV